MIKITNLHYSYKKKNVFNGLSIDFSGGHIYGLLGKNGTGKSTLLRNICGLLSPVHGNINVLGYTAFQRSADMLKHIFLVPEEFHVPSIKINTFVKSMAPFYPNFNRDDFDKYINEFEIPVDNALDKMSYGQKKKVIIAFGLAANTNILLMDEPTNGLDIMSKSQFRKVVAGSVNPSKCIIISTHQVKDIENLIDRITVIDSGEILFDQALPYIAEKLLFKMSHSLEHDPEAIFQEDTLNGKALVIPNKDLLETRVDLELLYKAIVSNPAAINQIFTT